MNRGTAYNRAMMFAAHIGNVTIARTVVCNKSPCQFIVGGLTLEDTWKVETILFCVRLR